jgi:transposase-like protein
MTMKEDPNDYKKTDAEPEVMATAVPASQGNENPIPAGHARFYCNKCHTVRSVELLPKAADVVSLVEQISHAVRPLNCFTGMSDLTTAVRSSRQGNFVEMCAMSRV